MLRRSSAAWHGTRIILRQVSIESTNIFDFILELYRCCEGDWSQLQSRASVSEAALRNFIDYSATFLANIGNYYVGRYLDVSRRSLMKHRELAIRNLFLRSRKTILKRSQRRPSLPQGSISSSQSRFLRFLPVTWDIPVT